MNVRSCLGPVVAAVVLAACADSTPPRPANVPPPPASTAAAATTAPPHATRSSESPLLAAWPGPHGGMPPFAHVRVDAFEPALEAAMDLERKEIDAIVAQTSPPTFENTIVAFEAAGRALDRVSRVYGIWSTSMNTPDFQAVERKMAPRIAAFSDEIRQNPKLFARIEAVYEATRNDGALGAEQKRVTWKHWNAFVRAGAKLDAPAKKRVAEINQRLATLFTTFGQNVLADEDAAIFLESEADLAGLPASVKSGAAAAAEAKGKKGAWAITNTRSMMEPFLTYSTRDDLREKVWKAYVSRGDNGDAHDNNKVIAEILQLRAERAKLLGYPTHAHFRLENAMAKTPDKAMALMEAVWKPAVGRVREEVADMQKLSKKKIEPWDYRFWMEKVRKAKYDLDQDQVKPYLQLEKLREGMFWVAGELFGFTFTALPAGSVEVFHPDVRVWEVRNKTTGKHVGLWYFDPYARPGKRSGAWMDVYRLQERFQGEVTTILSNNSNFVKPNAGEPVLISWTDATTLFHEFGHALHGLSSDVSYRSLACTQVARDYVEFPSQLLEHWLSTPEVLSKFAIHHQTGAPIPKELVAKIEKAHTFNQGFSTVEYLSGALIDMKLHLAADKPIDPAAFEKTTLEALGMPKEIAMRHRTAQFSHVFGSDSYSAGYYSYLWSDTLTADAYGAFTEGKGPYDTAVAERLRKNVFSVGDTIDPAAGYRAFRGRDVDTRALMKKRGFAK